MKVWWKSKTIWTAVLGIAIAVGSNYLGPEAVQQAVNDYGTPILGVLMVAMRLVTNSGVTAKNGGTDA